MTASALADLGEGRGTVLVGEAGVGKTRLAREVSDRAERRGWAVLSITASRTASSLIATGAATRSRP